MGDLTMTRKLYDLDSHRRDFSATVLRCDPDGERYAVVLDQTVFFRRAAASRPIPAYSAVRMCWMCSSCRM